MYYEIYIDVLFLNDFLLDFLLLLFLWKVLGCRTAYWRIFLGAAVGAGMSCIALLIPIPFPMMKLALFHVVINTIMIKTAYRITDRELFWEAFGMLYVSSFLMSGILRFLESVIDSLFEMGTEGRDATSNPWVAIGLLGVVIISYFLMQGIGFFVKRLQRNLRSKCRVVLYTSTGTYELQALLDTGNELVDKVSGKGVNVIDKALADKILSEEEMKTIRYVPYQSIGKAGVLPAVRITSMTIKDYQIDNPIIGISERDISTKASYQIILNPDILGGMSAC